MHTLILQLWNLNKMTIFMVTHDLQESFQLGTRLLVFDKVRIDPQSPERFGATITYDIPLKGHRQTAPPAPVALKVPDAPQPSVA
jgi:NitT/TauT family transport system ATP-binding protein